MRKPFLSFTHNTQSASNLHVKAGTPKLNLSGIFIFLMAWAILCTKAHLLQAQEFDLGFLQSQRFQDLVGQYQGEIRLQSSNGSVDQLIRSPVSLSLQVHPDSVEVIQATEFLGNHCQSKIGGLLELKKFSEEEPQIFSAEFSFNAGKCAQHYQANRITLIVWKNDQNELILETLFNEKQSTKSLFIHGYFTKTNSHPSPQISTVAHLKLPI